MSEEQGGVPPQLAVYRATIDNLDAALVHLLAERFRCTQQVGLLKAQLDLPPADPGRERPRRPRGRAGQADRTVGTAGGVRSGDLLLTRSDKSRPGRASQKRGPGAAGGPNPVGSRGGFQSCDGETVVLGMSGVRV